MPRGVLLSSILGSYLAECSLERASRDPTLAMIELAIALTNSSAHACIAVVIMAGVGFTLDVDRRTTNVGSKIRLPSLPMSFAACALASAGLLTSAFLLMRGPSSIPANIRYFFGKDPTERRHLQTTKKFTVLERVGHDKTSFV